VEDRKFVCPCYRHADDIARDGHCICHLFVDDDYEAETFPDPPLVAAGGDWPEIIVYGAAWCRHTLQTRRFLIGQGIPYRYVDVEEDASAAAKVREWNQGYLSTPTLDIGGSIVTEPSIVELAGILHIL
jgi:mycoredoxin